MSVQISGDRGGKIDRADYLKLDAIDQFSWLKEYYGYYGKFSIDEGSAALTFDVVDSLLAYERGARLKRKVELSGDVLTLLTEPRENNGVKTFNRLTWKKTG